MINELLAPVQSGVMQCWYKAGEVLYTIASSRQLSAENKILREQVEQLSRKIPVCVNIFRKSKIKLLDFKERYADDYT